MGTAFTRAVLAHCGARAATGALPPPPAPLSRWRAPVLFLPDSRFKPPLAARFFRYMLSCLVRAKVAPLSKNSSDQECVGECVVGGRVVGECCAASQPACMAARVHHLPPLLPLVPWQLGGRLTLGVGRGAGGCEYRMRVHAAVVLYRLHTG